MIPKILSKRTIWHVPYRYRPKCPDGPKCLGTHAKVQKINNKKQTKTDRESFGHYNHSYDWKQLFLIPTFSTPENDTSISLLSVSWDLFHHFPTAVEIEIVQKATQ